MSRFSPGFIGGGSGNDGYTKILLHMEGANGGSTFTDSNANGLSHSWTANSAVTSSAAAKFGSTSLNCGAASANIDTPDSSDFTVGSGDWTVDFWFNQQGGVGTTRNFFGQQSAYFGGILLSNGCYLTVNSTTVLGSTAISASGWHHYAGVRVGNILKLFVDGVQEGGNVAFSGAVTDGTAVFGVGKIGGQVTNFWNGFIDEFRLSVGIARWTSNFTPPGAAYS